MKINLKVLENYIKLNYQKCNSSTDLLKTHIYCKLKTKIYIRVYVGRSIYKNLKTAELQYFDVRNVFTRM